MSTAYVRPVSAAGAHFVVDTFHMSLTLLFFVSSNQI